MKEINIFIIAGLGFGDEGKGNITEFLASEYNAKATIRYNGGPQAAHYIVREDGTLHCFSQLASSSFVNNMKSHLAHSVLVKPSNLFVELDCLDQKKCSNIRSRFSLDPNCYVVTPWHGMIGKMEETVRGAGRHGSVGMGVGKAALDRKNANPNALQIKDFYKEDTLVKKLASLWDEADKKAKQILSENPDNKELNQIYAACRDGCTPEIMKQEYVNSAKMLEHNLITDSQFAECIEGNVILEGAQGVLIDCQHGFLPHVTKTDTTFRSAIPFLKATNLEKNNIKKVGILRAYSARHGAGPFVTEDSSLNEKYPELNNSSNVWQGKYRVGHLDLIATRYAMLVSGGPDFLALTHLDVVGKQEEFCVCNSYEYKGDASLDQLEDYFELSMKKGKLLINAIKYSECPSVEHQFKLTKLLFDCVPASFIEFKGWDYSPRSAQQMPANLKIFLDFLQSNSGLNCPVKVISCGPMLQDKKLI